MTRAGPFDIIGDVHGCFDELAELLGLLGYVLDDGAGARHPEGRRALFVGDLVNRGPATPDVLRLAMGMVAAGQAECVLGNHDQTLLEALQPRRPAPLSAAPSSRASADTSGALSHGLAESLDQLAGEPPEFLAQVVAFITAMAGHLVLDGGKLVVCHDGVPTALAGATSGDVTVVYGHTPVEVPVWANGTICIDTGCVYGGRLTALRYPERDLVAVAARRIYWLPAHLRGRGL